LDKVAVLVYNKPILLLEVLVKQALYATTLVTFLSFGYALAQAPGQHPLSPSISVVSYGSSGALLTFTVKHSEVHINSNGDESRSTVNFDVVIVGPSRVKGMWPISWSAPRKLASDPKFLAGEETYKPVIDLKPGHYEISVTYTDVFGGATGQWHGHFDVGGTGQVASKASCDPNWSPQWDQLAPERQEVLQKSGAVDQMIETGGGLDAIAADERLRGEEDDSLVFQKAQAQGQVPPGMTSGEYTAFRRGLIEIYHCRKGDISAPATTSVPSGATQPEQVGSLQHDVNPQQPAQIDVRYLSADSRPLTDAEMRDLRNSLRWDPESVPLSPGGAARSNLVDDKGRRLGSVLVRWDKAVTPKTAQASGTPRGHFTLQIENGTSCVFQSSAEIDDSQGFVVVSGVTWSGWLTLHQPERGQTSQAQGDAALSQAYPSLALKPLTAYSTLSGCMTPKNP
jgi:hypothetical protein